VGEVAHIDSLQHSNPVFRRVYSDFYMRMVKLTPAMLGWVFDRTDEPWKTDNWRLLLDRMNTAPLVKKIREFAPDICICTHFLPAQIIGSLIRRQRIDTKLAIVVTDFDIHAMWLSKLFHHYFVALDEAKAHLAMLGFPPGRITVSGIPIDPVFSVRKNAATLREKHGLQNDLPVVLVSGGALGVSSAELMVRVLGHLQTPAQVAVICGRSEELQASVREVVANLDAPHLKFHVMGYTNEMDEWMKLSDLFIGKPGGLSTSEAMACGLPMVVFQPIPGQEERNSDHLLEHGAAVRCNQLTTLAYKVDQLLQDPARLRGMCNAARALGRPAAAQTVVDTLLAADESPVVISRPHRRKVRKEFK
jgi:processive 1,2-diacylglycerol beta-glucosyltransferase